MKKHLLSKRRNFFKSGTAALVLILAAVIIPAFAAENTGTIAWRSDLAKVSTEARKQDKKILLRFSAEWCPPCRVMDANVWPGKDVQTAVEKGYIPVEIDVDAKGAANLARQYGVRGVPTIVTLDADGKVLARSGFMRKKELLRFLKS
jgi:protein disulfide-isomerase